MSILTLKLAEHITNGAVTATEHEVRKAVGGCERYGFAHFITPQPDYIMKSTLSKYNDRFSQGIAYGEWSNRSYAKYSKTV
jgi:isopenicillin N synthase-like dioxygenase